ncbi:hypothetical protein NEHOM01_0222 [Nematocida homosporus]|uniref:uncharacterized protein n=1 Tax=Nematocida homosporus TaxID=1912981 RepID=UPI0022204E5D|nr:uncharacterized protein NEHOM01_0222 [Nematocida homosporus]KAI5184547.1 hypothetical protein NEHOM01_0222 [Nematocida homosporus]
MIIALSAHEEFERTIFGYGFVKKRTVQAGSLTSYAFDGKRLVAYTAERVQNRRQYVYFQQNNQVHRAEFESAWIDACLRERSTQRSYRVRFTYISNGTLQGRIFYLESANGIKIMSAVEGIDHASEIFEEVPVEKEGPPAGISAESFFAYLFFKYTSQK